MGSGSASPLGSRCKWLSSHFFFFILYKKNERVGSTDSKNSVSSVELWYLHNADWERSVDEAEMRMRSDECHHVEFK